MVKNDALMIRRSDDIDVVAIVLAMGSISDRAVILS